MQSTSYRIAIDQYKGPTTIARMLRCMRLGPSLMALCMAIGCNQSPYELAPVDGAVSIDGQPLTDARIMFAPIARGESRDAGKPAFGRLGSDGRFTLTTYRDNDGAVVGEHWVTLIYTGEGGQNGAGGTSNSSASRPKFDRLAVPRKVAVAGGQENHVDIKLTAAEVARFGRLDD